MHLLHRLAILGAAGLALASSGCDKLPFGKKEKVAATATAIAPPPGPVVPAKAPVAAFAVPFAGSYKRTAKIAFRNGQRVTVANSKGLATLTIEPGKVTFDQTYPASDVPEARVTQTYHFTEADMKPAEGGGFDVALVFDKMESNTKNYFADDKDPKLQARRIGANAWQIGLLLKDANGTHGGSEFR